jgi:hypothetical protein
MIEEAEKNPNGAEVNICLCNVMEPVSKINNDAAINAVIDLWPMSLRVM